MALLTSATALAPVSFWTDGMRIGMLTPSSNTVLEPVTMRMVVAMGGNVSVHFSRIRVTSISQEPESRGQFDPETMVAAARLLADARVEVIVWNGTSGGWEGLDADREIVAAIEGATSIPTTTGTLATIDAFRELGVRRYGLVVPYDDATTARIKNTFASAGFECVASSNECITVNWNFAQIQPETIAGRARELAKAHPDAIAVFCTNLNGAPVADTLEAELDVPVLDSVVVCLWGAFHRLQRKPALNGWGRLMAGY